MCIHTHTYIIIHSERTKEQIYKDTIIKSKKHSIFQLWDSHLDFTYAVDTAQKLRCDAHEYVWGIISLENVASSPVLILLLCSSNLLSNVGKGLSKFQWVETVLFIHKMLVFSIPLSCESLSSQPGSWQIACNWQLHAISCLIFWRLSENIKAFFFISLHFVNLSLSIPQAYYNGQLKAPSLLELLTSVSFIIAMILLTNSETVNGSSCSFPNTPNLTSNVMERSF